MNMRRIGRNAAHSAVGDTSGAAHQRLDALFDAWFDPVYRFCQARTGSRTRAEDAAAETFADAARLYADGRADEVTERWLFAVARRRVIDQWRSSERHRHRLERLVNTTPSAPSIARSPVRDEDDFVRSALDSLPDRQRAAIVLRYIEEYSVSEVADILDVGYEAAESLLARGRRSFARAYREVSQS